MGYDYNFEDAISKIPGAIEEMESLRNGTIPACMDTARDIAKDVGAAQLSKDVEALCVSLEGLQSLLSQMIGEAGDSATTATMHGCLAAAKKLNSALNG